MLIQAKGTGFHAKINGLGKECRLRQESLRTDCSNKYETKMSNTKPTISLKTDGFMNKPSTDTGETVET